MKKYIVYATNKNGDGFVQKIDEFEDVEDFKIHVGMFNDDVIITIESEFKPDEDEDN